jgi:hypothetical protein
MEHVEYIVHSGRTLAYVIRAEISPKITRPSLPRQISNNRLGSLFTRLEAKFNGLYISLLRDTSSEHRGDYRASGALRN